MKIGLFYGSNTGSTEAVAEMIKEEFDDMVPVEGIMEIFDIRDVKISDMLNYKNLIIGSSTWNIGELQDDWEEAYEQLDEMDFSGVKMALFGVGDQYGYADNYCDAIGILGKKFREQGAELIAFTDIDDSYDFDESEGVENGRWMGLAVDEDNQSELTRNRVDDWVMQLIDEFDVYSMFPED